MPMASSLDTVGPITKTVADLALVMETIAGQDVLTRPPCRIKLPCIAKRLKRSKGTDDWRAREYFKVAGMDSEVRKITEDKIAELAKRGCKIKSQFALH